MSTDLPDRISADEVLRLGAGRWKSGPSLAAASRRGTGPGGRHTTGTRSSYDRASVELFFAEEAEREAERLARLRAKAAHMRARKAARRAAAESTTAGPLTTANEATTGPEMTTEGENPCPFSEPPGGGRAAPPTMSPRKTASRSL